MFAVIKTGGKQYRVAAEDQITIMSLPGAPGDVLAFEDVLSLFADGAMQIGTPFVSGVTIAGEIVQQKRSPKSISFKKRRRKNSKRKRGHRQELTVVRITQFLTGGAKPTLHPAAHAATAPAALLSSAAHPAALQSSAAHAATAPAALLSAEAHADHSAGIAASAAASVAAARAAGHDTSVFKKLDSAVGTADDIELIGGIGPTIARQLHGIGIYHFWQIAAMKQDDIDAVEHEVGFKGRAARDHWKDQAIELIAGKGPRSKVDQARAAHHD